MFGILADQKQNKNSCVLIVTHVCGPTPEKKKKGFYQLVKFFQLTTEKNAIIVKAWKKDWNKANYKYNQFTRNNINSHDK